MLSRLTQRFGWVVSKSCAGVRARENVCIVSGAILGMGTATLCHQFSIEENFRLTRVNLWAANFSRECANLIILNTIGGLGGLCVGMMATSAVFWKTCFGFSAFAGANLLLAKYMAKQMAKKQ